MAPISVVIVTRNRREELSGLLSDLFQTGLAAQDDITVVDNASQDGTAAQVGRLFPRARIVEHASNRGAPAARNSGVAATRGEILVFLDDDVRVEDPEFLGRIRKLFTDQPEVAVAAFRILDPRTYRARGFEIPRRRKDRPLEACETSYFVSAGCAVRREVYAAVGGMDESLTYGFEELDFSYRAVSRGYRIFYRPEIWVLHSLSPTGRPAWRRLYYFYRNKIWISARYLPWPMFLSQLAVWSGYFLKESVRIGRPDVFAAAFCSGVAGLPGQWRRRRQDRIPPHLLRRLERLEGRLYY